MGFAMNVPRVTILLRTQEQILVAIHALMVLLVVQEPMISLSVSKNLGRAGVIVNVSLVLVKIEIVAQVQWVAMFAMPTALAQRVPQIITHRTINALLVLLV